jgi:hypothetical protein
MVQMGGDVDGFADFDSAAFINSGFDEGQSLQIGSQLVSMEFGANIGGGELPGQSWSGNWFFGWNITPPLAVPEKTSTFTLLALGGVAVMGLSSNRKRNSA